MVDGWHNPLQKSIKIVNEKLLREYDRSHCEKCGSTEQPIAVHHFIPRSHQRLDISENLIALCLKCHERIHMDADFRRDVLCGLDVASMSKLARFAPTWGGWVDGP